MSQNHYKWKNHLVIVMTNSPHSEDYLNFVKDYERNRTGVFERKMIRKTIVQEKLKPAFQIALYTLDGKLQCKINKIVPMSQIFNLIDNMNIRKAEIKHNKKNRVIHWT